MAAVSEETASLTSEEARLAGDCVKGFTPFQRDDVLVAKITPCFENGKIVIANIQQDHGFGSTEFHVIRPDPEKLHARYMLHCLRQPHVRLTGQRRMTGSAGQRRVPAHFLSTFEIPLPTFDEQKRIAEILDRAEALRSGRRAALALLDELTQSIFLDMFGDPIPNPKGWPMMKLEEVAEKITDGEHLTPKRAHSLIKLLSARNVRDGFIDFDNVDFVGTDEYERISKRCKPEYGDVLVSCSGTIGRVAMVRTTELFSLVKSAALVKPKRDVVDSTYLESHLRTRGLQAKMRRAAHSSNQANLFQGPI